MGASVLTRDAHREPIGLLRYCYGECKSWELLDKNNEE